MAAKTKIKSQWQEIKIKLEQESSKNLVKLIKSLYDLAENNRNFITANIVKGKVSNKVYKEIIENAIYLDIYDQNDEIEFSKARKAISDFRKATGDAKLILDLMIHYVEIGTDQARGGHIDYPEYYDSLESMFNSIIKCLTGKDEQYADYFRPRLENIIKDANEAYGYKESIQEIFAEAFEV